VLALRFGAGAIGCRAVKAKSALALAPLLAACATAPTADDPQLQFFAALSGLCGQAFEGRVISSDAADRELAAQRLVMHVRECSESEVRIPFHVGDDRSRTWVVTRTASGLRLKHDHRHEDGSEDALTQYGGDTVAPGTAVRQEFPADPFSRDLFEREGIPQSAANVWAIEIHPGRTFAYELRRPGRHFRVEFDLGRPVPAPPPPWGAE
jgi:hypothetical protein